MLYLKLRKDANINALVTACKAGDLGKINEILIEKHQASLLNENLTNDNKTLLHIAAEAGQYNIVQYLLAQKGIELNTADSVCFKAKVTRR